ncbi:MAG: DNA-binding transcriptional ArsR family regulator [Candidatus Paceibacteria bacterium]|jgi:DNA-binding transcriptional ArsR family regulator
MQTKRIEKILKPLASKRRLDILKALKENGVLPVWEISSIIKLSFKSTSKHLLELYRVNLVDFERRGQESHYYVPQQKSRLVKYIVTLL